MDTILFIVSILIFAIMLLFLLSAMNRMDDDFKNN